MNWNSSGDRPAYQQIMAAIRGAILTGELEPRRKAPAVCDLVAGCILPFVRTLDRAEPCVSQ